MSDFDYLKRLMKEYTTALELRRQAIKKRRVLRGEAVSKGKTASPAHRDTGMHASDRKKMRRVLHWR